MNRSRACRSGLVGAARGLPSRHAHAGSWTIGRPPFKSFNIPTSSDHSLLAPMFGWGSQAGDGGATSGWCWSQWGASQAPAPPPEALPVSAAPPRPAAQLLPPPLLPPAAAPQLHSRSGLAALAAQRAHQRAAGPAADPFVFSEEAPAHAAGEQRPPAAQRPPAEQRPPLPLAPAAAALESGPTWRGRSASFLHGGGPKQAASSAYPQQQPQQRQAAAAPPRRPAADKPAAGGGWPAAPAPKPAAPRPAAAKPASGGGWPAAASAAAAAAPAGHTAAKPQAQPAPLVACTLSLERYLDLWQLLGKGSGRVQPLSELEKSVLKAADLKQVGAAG